MDKAELIEKLKDWCRKAHQIELTIGSETRLSNDSTMAYMESQYARMYAGDLLRLALLEGEARTTSYFNPKNHNAHVPKGFDCYSLSEVDTILMLKDRLRSLFYEVLDSNVPVIFSFNVTEFLFYKRQLESSIKRTDQRLGLLLGGLVKF